MKMTLVAIVLGSLGDTKAAWASWIASIKSEVDLLIIDNAPECGDGQQQFFANFVMPFWKGQVRYEPQSDNLGLIKSIQLAYELCTDSDILAFIHNDVFIYTPAWDVTVKQWFEEHPETGLLGFFGAEGVHPSSGRFYVWNNMLEAEIHGWRFTQGVKQVAVLDGLCMIANRKMLAERNGVDQEYQVHHFYDLDLSLESLDRGYKNYVLPAYIHHQSGVTACRPLFQDWANKNVEHGEGQTGEQVLYQKNLERFKAKWAAKLPYHIANEWLRSQG